MSEREGGESKTMGAFLLGFLLGVLLTLGGSGAFFVMTQQRERQMAEVARAEAEAARAAEAEARRLAEARLKEWPKPGDPEREKVKKALDGVKAIEKALEAHRLTHGEYPPSLELLVQPLDGKPAALEVNALLDPWERPYHYDPAKVHPMTGAPLVFSTGPDPKDRTGHIRTWADQATKPIKDK